MADEALVFGWLVTCGYGREFMPRSKSPVPSVGLNKSAEYRGGRSDVQQDPYLRAELGWRSSSPIVENHSAIGFAGPVGTEQYSPEHVCGRCDARAPVDSSAMKWIRSILNSPVSRCGIDLSLDIRIGLI
jgi:hypothetical protein